MQRQGLRLKNLEKSQIMRRTDKSVRLSNLALLSHIFILT